MELATLPGAEAPNRGQGHSPGVALNQPSRRGNPELLREEPDRDMDRPVRIRGPHESSRRGGRSIQAFSFKSRLPLEGDVLESDRHVSGDGLQEIPSPFHGLARGHDFKDPPGHSSTDEWEHG
jgi:hypothetical protein